MNARVGIARIPFFQRGSLDHIVSQQKQCSAGFGQTDYHDFRQHFGIRTENGWIPDGKRMDSGWKTDGFRMENGRIFSWRDFGGSLAAMIDQWVCDHSSCHGRSITKLCRFRTNRFGWFSATFGSGWKTEGFQTEAGWIPSGFHPFSIRLQKLPGITQNSLSETCRALPLIVNGMNYDYKLTDRS